MLKENKNSNSLSMLYEGTTPTIEKFSNFVFTKKLNSFELSFISTSVVPTIFTNGAGEENRTPVYSLEGCGSTIKLHLHQVGIFNYTYFLFIVNSLLRKKLKIMDFYFFISNLIIPIIDDNISKIQEIKLV